MKSILKCCLPLLFCFAWVGETEAEDWRESMEHLVYSPRYFGPNAFPMPVMRDGRVSDKYEIELKGEYHYYSGDKTQDIVARATLPFVRGRAGVEVQWCIKEKYKMTPATRDERSAVELESPIKYGGDIVVSAFFQVLKHPKWVDMVVSANIKTASGGRLCDARFTDAASYWFDLNVGRDLWVSADKKGSLRAQLLGGFYCWMTNDMVHRQNDAIAYGGGLTGRYRGFTLASNVNGIVGYEKNGDRPVHWNNKLSYEIKNNIVSFNYTHGFKDRLYDTYSLSYTRCF